MNRTDEWWDDVTIWLNDMSKGDRETIVKVVNKIEENNKKAKLLKRVKVREKK